MRKFLTTLTVVLCFVLVGNGQYVNIPDANFKSFLQAKYPTAFNGAGQMDTTNSLIVSEDSITCPFQNISDLSGIEYFDNLTNLKCSWNNLTQLPRLPDNLIELICESNQLTALPILPKKLFKLWAANNKLTSIQPLSSSLDDVGLGGNLLTSIPNIPIYARFFGCGNNPNLYCLPPLPDSLYSFALNIYFDTANIKCLPNLPHGCIINGTQQSYPVCNTSYNPNNCITYPIRPMVDINDMGFAGYLIKNCRDCFGRGNGFWDSVSNMGSTPQRLDTSSWITKVKVLSPTNESIINLSDIKYFNQLEVLDVSNNMIQFVPLLPKKLKEFNAARNNNIDSVVAPFPDSLTILEINNNKIKELPALPNTLQALYVDFNNLNCLPYLPSSLVTLFYDTSKIKCLPNIPSGLGLTYPICNATNNPNNCPTLNPYINIPDTNFGKFLITKYPSCLYKDASNKYWMDTTCGGVVNEDSIICSNKAIANLEGIQYFRSLQLLNCDSNSLSQLPTLSNNLIHLNCLANNNLLCLPKFPSSLKYLAFDGNNIKCVPSSIAGFTQVVNPSSTYMYFPSWDWPVCTNDYNPNNCSIIPNNYVTLTDSGFVDYLQLHLNNGYTNFVSSFQIDTTLAENFTVNAMQLFSQSYAIKNIDGIKYFKRVNTLTLDKNAAGSIPLQVSSIPQLPASLKELNILNLQLNNIAALPNGIEIVNCKQTKINHWESFGNALTLLDLSQCENYNLPALPNTLVILDLSRGINSHIDSLPQLPNSLKKVDCSSNIIKYIPNIPTALIELFCDNNALTSLPNLPSTLTSLDCAGNQNLKCLPVLPASLTYLNVDTAVHCLPNIPSGLTTTLPICNTTNNPNNCPTLNPYVNIPDTNFGKFLIAQYQSCLYKDASNKYWMDTTCGAVVNEDSLDCWNKNIASISGIEYFKNLKALFCGFNNNITSLPYLPNTLTVLGCNSCNLSTLPNLPNTIKILDCSINPIISLPLLPTNLTFLDCNGCQLNNLPVLGDSLKTLYLDYNINLSCLPFLPSVLTTLWINNTNIKCIPNLVAGSASKNLPLCSSNPSINVNNCTVYADSLKNLFNVPDSGLGEGFITYFYPHAFMDFKNKYWIDTTASVIISETNLGDVNQFRHLGGYGIKSLNGIQYLKSLKKLNVFGNQLTTIDYLREGLEEFQAPFNKITNIITLPNSIKNNLELSNNNLTILPKLPDNLEGLNLYNNQLTQLPSFPKTLKHLEVGLNQLTNLPTLPDSLKQLGISKNPQLHCVPKLPAGLQNLTFDSATIKCLPNLPSKVELRDVKNNLLSTYPICNPTNNPNQCQIYPSVSGKVFTDNNSNSTKDANDLYRPLVRVSLNNEQTSYSNLLGEYNIVFDTLGSYTLKATPPPFYKAVPDSFNISIASGGLSVTLPDIALQPIVVKDSFFVKMVNYNLPRPRRQVAYAVTYANAGTTTDINDNKINISWSSNITLDSVSSALQSATSTTANGIVVNVGKLLPGQFGSFNVYFKTDSTANIGDSVNTKADLLYNTNSVSDKLTIPIVNSYDPNDKAATPKLTVQQVQQGAYIDYTIRFQNLGNAEAIDVVIEDSLSKFLLIDNNNPIVVLPASHNMSGYYTSNGKIYFEFYGINLPASSQNEPLSHGFVRFRVKAQPSLALGAIVPNDANIVFDYNKAIKTNVATTEVKNIIVPVRLLNYNLKIRNQKSEIEHTWTVGAEINVANYVVERSKDGRLFEAVGVVKAIGNNTYSLIDNLTTNYQLLTTIYYRLKIVDNDGVISYSEIKTVNLKSQTLNQINIYPNPTKGAFTVDVTNAKQLWIYDVVGKEVYQSTVNSQQSTVLVKEFKKGIYLVKLLMNHGEVKTSKLVVE